MLGIDHHIGFVSVLCCVVFSRKRIQTQTHERLVSYLGGCGWPVVVLCVNAVRIIYHANKIQHL